jgi:hypothetical protein
LSSWEELSGAYVNPISLSSRTTLVLTAEELREIDGALSEFKVHADRMNDHQMKVVEQ